MPVVVHVLSELRPSGMERMLLASLSEWHARGWSVVVIGQAPESDFAQQLRSAGCVVVIVPSLRTISGLRELRTQLRLIRPDTVHMHTEQSHGPIAVTARIACPRARLVRTVHSIFKFTGVTKIRRHSQHLAARFVGTVFVGPSRDVADNERSRWHTPCVVVENWVSEDFLEDSESGEKADFDDPEPRIRLALVGNCEHVKNHEAVLGPAADMPEIQIVHVGDTANAEPEEMLLLHSLEASGRAKVLGVRRDVSRVLAGVDGFLMPSRHEGMAVALAEALCMGLPALVSDVPGLHWTSDQPSVRHIWPGGDWKVAMTEFLRDIDDLRRVASQHRHENRLRFAPARGVEQYIQIYKGNKDQV